LTDYYQILGITPRSTIDDVKRSFRRRAKQLHPDVRSRAATLKRTFNPDEEMRILLKAYEILSNPRKRLAYDRIRRQHILARKKRFDFREYLRSRSDDLTSQSRLLFYDLLNSRSQEALILYQRLLRHPRFRLDRYLEWEDYMDCTFLLAEELDAVGEHEQALALLFQLYWSEQRRPYFKHFIEEVTDRIKAITCIRLINVLAPETMLVYLQQLLSFDYSKKDTAMIYKKIAESYSRMGNNKKAVESLRKGLEYNAKLPGVKKLKERIGFPEMCVS
jgi:tetratricopeptide (TPR) repeat protein